MPLLPVVRSRQSRVRGHSSQVAGALIPDNTQHSWRDDVGGDSTVGDVDWSLRGMRIVRNSANVNRLSGAASRTSSECGYTKQGVRNMAHSVLF